MSLTQKFVGLIVGLAFLLAGCSQPAGPPLAGGKPFSHWLQAIKDPDPKVRKQAAFKLGNIGPQDEGALPALLEALQDKHAQVRGEAILAILKFGPEAAQAEPILTRMQKEDRDDRVRELARKAIEKFKRDRGQ